jgi:hypothetical protein
VSITTATGGTTAAVAGAQDLRVEYTQKAEASYTRRQYSSAATDYGQAIRAVRDLTEKSPSCAVGSTVEQIGAPLEKGRLATLYWNRSACWVSVY